MKFALWVFAGSLAMSQQLLAQDYYVPIKKELEPLARLPLEAFRLDDTVLEYRLPQDITGRPLDILMKRDTNGVGPGRTYKGALATATCMGTDKLPACVVQHRNLKIDKSELLAFAQRKYQDPRLLTQMSLVQEVFSNPNEPIGFIARRGLIKARSDLQIWNSFMSMPDGSKRDRVKVQLQGESGVFRFASASGKSRKGTGEIVGEITEVMAHGSSISGRWTLQNEKGWFQWRLNSDKSGFEGSWGLIGPHAKRTVEGIWSGTMP